ncbi:IS3 family transposase [Paenibacillus silvae]|nr:IS3 family transposase [Paenibacillus silvae]MCK6152832.1 IS3 family transposase [Paenibacillus silvae]MCK6271284.1 IS3 family transposase [Paenibacillus silvae]
MVESFDTLGTVKRENKSYMTYYNQHRYQWNLKRMTPVQYRDHRLKAV